MPCSSVRNSSRNARFERPNSAMSAHVSPPQRTVQSAISRISCSAWRLALPVRGSSSSSNTASISSMAPSLPVQAPPRRIPHPPSAQAFSSKCNSPGKPPPPPTRLTKPRATPKLPSMLILSPDGRGFAFDPLLLLLLALLIEPWVGWAADLLFTVPHPVRIIGRVIGVLDRKLNRSERSEV